MSTGDLTGPWPPGTFDLIVLSELLYYLGDADLDDPQRAGGATIYGYL